MKNILYVHYGDNWIRGSEIVLLEQLQNSLNHGIKPTLWCNTIKLSEKARELGVNVIKDRFVNLGYWTLPKWDFLQFIFLVFKGRNLICQNNIEMVHCNNGAPCQWMSLVCKWLKIPLLLHLHARYQQRDRFILLFHFADKVIGVSKAVIDVFNDSEMEKHKLSVVYNGISPLRVLPKKPVNIRQMVGAKENDFLLLYIGSLIERKGLDTLIRAMALINKKYPVKLAIFGSGSDQSTLNKLINTLNLNAKIKIFPAVADVENYYASDVNCFVSIPKEEVFGLTLAEASLAGLPIISSDINGINEIYEDQKSALLVEPSNIAQVTTAIVSMMVNPQLAKQLSNNAHYHIKKNFSSTKQAQKMAKEYFLLNDSKRNSLMQSVFNSVVLLTRITSARLKNRLNKFSFRFCHYE